MIKKKIANIPFGLFITVLAGAMVNGKPNALKVKPTIMMYPGYFDLKDRVGSVFQTYSTMSTAEPK